MSFGEHLEELRRCCIKGLLGLVVGIVVSLFFSRAILRFILQPASLVLEAHHQNAQLQALGPSDVFLTYLKVALLSGIILSMPWMLWQFWNFVAIGLYEREQRFIKLLSPASLGLFAAGVLFMYFIVLPVVLNFFVTFSGKITIPRLEPTALQRWLVPSAADVSTDGVEEVSEPLQPSIPLLARDPVDPPVGSQWINTTRRIRCVQTKDGTWITQLRPAGEMAAVRNDFGLNYYISFVLMLSLAFGLAFELPLAVVFITISGIATPSELAASRRYVLFGVVIMAALLTPPDVISQVLLAVPMIVLFEGSLAVCKVLKRRADRADTSGGS